MENPGQTIRSRDLVLSVAAQMSLDASAGGTLERFPSREVQERLAGLTRADRDRFFQLAGWFWKTGTREARIVLALLDHALENRPQSWFAYYARDGQARRGIEAAVMEQLRAEVKASEREQDLAFINAAAARWSPKPPISQGPHAFVLCAEMPRIIDDVCAVCRLPRSDQLHDGMGVKPPGPTLEVIDFTPDRKGGRR